MAGIERTVRAPCSTNSCFTVVTYPASAGEPASVHILGANWEITGFASGTLEEWEVLKAAIRAGEFD